MFSLDYFLPLPINGGRYIQVLTKISFAKLFGEKKQFFIYILFIFIMYFT